MVEEKERSTDETAMENGENFQPNFDPDRPILQYMGIKYPDFPVIQRTGIEKFVKSIMEAKCRDDDLLLCTYPKSGTHWVDEIIRMLRLGKAEYSKTTKATYMLEAIGVEALDKMPSPRFFNTHFPYGFLPKEHVQKGCKVVHCMRNPKDTLVSLYNHVKKDKICLRTGFPGTWNDFFESFLNDTNNMYGGWFKYEKEFYHAKEKGELRNVHTMYFEDMKKNGVKEIIELAKFLELPCKENLAKEIDEKCSFNNFSASVQERVPKKVWAQASTDGTNFTIRKGQVGEWKNWFTVTQRECFDEHYCKEMEGINLKFTYEL